MKRYGFALIICVVGLSLMGNSDCASSSRKVVSDSGVTKTSVKIPVNQATGLTVEQENVRERLEQDNKPGSIKHLYVISAFSGDVLIYSTVKGKVTSSGKRLTPTSVDARDGQYVGSQHNGFPVRFGGSVYRTSEVLQDDGTYGNSVPYIFWFDVKGNYHQHWISGGQILHISDVPLRVSKVIINMEEVTE